MPFTYQKHAVHTKNHAQTKTFSMLLNHTNKPPTCRHTIVFIGPPKCYWRKDLSWIGKLIKRGTKQYWETQQIHVFYVSFNNNNFVILYFVIEYLQCVFFYPFVSSNKLWFVENPEHFIWFFFFLCQVILFLGYSSIHVYFLQHAAQNCPTWMTS